MSDLDSFAFGPGQQVQCKTRFDDVLKGEVVAFDLNSKILVLRSPSSNSSNYDLNFLVLDSVSDVEILEEARSDHNMDLPSLEMKHIQAKRASALNERMRLVEAVGNGVSQDGVSLYTAFSKIYDRASDVTWNDKTKLVVMNSVIISPPYKEANCEAITPKTSKDALTYVRNVVRKYWEGSGKQRCSE